MKTDVKNYRPISQLLLTSKIIEESIQNQIQNYPQSHYFVLSYIYQSGFRANHPKNTCCWTRF